MTKGAYIALVAVLLSAGALIYPVQKYIDGSRGEAAGAEEFLYLPDPANLKVASLGYDELVADLLWLKAVQNIGERTITPEGYEWIYRALDTVTTLDPNYVAPYEMGAMVLTLMADKVELSNDLLKKGIAHNPDVWQLKFYLGFNYFFYLKNYRLAAFYIAQAAEVPGSARYLPYLASRLYVQADDPAYALEFLLRMYESTEDEKLRAKMADRIVKLRSAVAASALQDMVGEYAERHGRRPAGLSELVSAGMLSAVPEDPAGGRFYIDEDGVVRSSAVKEKLGIHTKK